MYKYKTKPRDHQQEYLDKYKHKQIFAIFGEMGVGKSKMLCDNVGWAYSQGKINAWLCVAPKGVYLNWLNEEIPKHLGCEHIVKAWSTPKSEKKKTELKEFLTIERDQLKIFIINIEALRDVKGKAFKAALYFVQHHDTFITLDESTTIKDHKTQQSKAMHALSRWCHWKRIASGMPAPQSQLDMFSQMGFLGESILGYRSYYAFRARYAELINMSMGTRTFKKEVGPKNTEELKSKIAPFSIRIRKEDCLDLPDKIYTTRHIELSREQQKAYKQIKEEAYALLDSGEVVTAPIVITQLMRLHTVVCGFVRTETGGEQDFPVNPKLDALLNCIEEIGNEEKIIIWASYRRNIQSILRRLSELYGKESVVGFYGDTSDEQREYARTAFQDKGSPVRYFVGNPASAKFGITLTASSNVIYFSNDYNLEKRVQSEDRAHRIGQTRSVVYTDLIAPGTVDEKILKVLRNKRQLSAELMNDKWREWLK